MDFKEVCTQVERALTDDWDTEEFDRVGAIELQKRAIIGYEDAVERMKARIGEILRGKGLMPAIPGWYETAEDGIFHEVWGWAGVAEWFGDRWAQSSSAKIIGDRIYFLEGSVMRLMPQRIDCERRIQLIRALLLLSPEERLDKEFHEVYMLDGTRVTIFREGLAKDGQEVIIFRRYVIPTYSFQEQADRGTIPAEAVPLFESMVRVGYNVVFTGSVRSAKTTFLSTWQRYEDPTLEGVMVETDPEIPMHQLIPEAPVIQLLADGDKLGRISKNLLRSDADYFILAEARDGLALDTAVRLARKGTKRMKMTFHTRDPEHFPADAAVEIVRSLGGNEEETTRRVAGGFDYIFHFVNVRRQNRKKLNAIYEMGVGSADGVRWGQGAIYTTPICLYDYGADRWQWSGQIGEDKRRYGQAEAPEAFFDFEMRLAALAEFVPSCHPDATLGRMS